MSLNIGLTSSALGSSFVFVDPQVGQNQPAQPVQNQANNNFNSLRDLIRNNVRANRRGELRRALNELADRCMRLNSALHTMPDADTPANMDQNVNNALLSVYYQMSNIRNISSPLADRINEELVRHLGTTTPVQQGEESSLRRFPGIPHDLMNMIRMLSHQ